MANERANFNKLPSLFPSSSTKQYGFGNPWYYQQQIRSSSSCSTSSLSSTTSSMDSPLSDEPSSLIICEKPSPTRKPTATAAEQENGDKGPSTVSVQKCDTCNRPGGPLFCFGCGFWLASGRVAKPCTLHSKVFE